MKGETVEKDLWLSEKHYRTGVEEHNSKMKEYGEFTQHLWEEGRKIEHQRMTDIKSTFQSQINQHMDSFGSNETTRLTSQQVIKLHKLMT